MRVVVKQQSNMLHLTDEGRRILAIGQCLTDAHMWIAAQILKKQFPEQKGLQDTIFIAESRAERRWDVSL